MWEGEGEGEEEVEGEGGRGRTVYDVHVCGMEERERRGKVLREAKVLRMSPPLQCRLFPKDRMCMIFDMTGSGLSQMDMELMRFIVNSFKIYFPDILAILLVYNMPWILQGQSCATS